MKHTTTIILIAIALLGCTKQKENTVNTSPKDNLRALWQILDERYCYFEERGIDWEGVYYDTAPKIRNIQSVYGLFNVMKEMLDTLNDGHVNLYSPFDVSSCTGWYEDYPRDYSSEIVFSDDYVGENYKKINGIYYGLIQRNIGYIYVSTFSNTFSSTTFKYIDYYFRKTKGLIIDVRDNGGGSLEQAERLAACFHNEKLHIGYIRHKTGTGHSDFSEPEAMYVDPADSLINWTKRPTVVLTNRRSYSATNTFVLKMQDAPNVVIIGGRTGGGGGMPLSQELPIGWMVRFSAVPMYDRDMKTIEFGIDPDEEIHITGDDYDNRRDAIIDRAIEIINDWY